MYSVVLMMALSGGSEAVDFGHRGGGCSGGGYGCSGYSGYSSCYGGGYGGCSGGGYSSCYGGGYGSCYGGGYASCSGGRHGHRHHRCSGGYGGCYGGGYVGCYGSSYGGCYGGGYGGCYGGGSGGGLVYSSCYGGYVCSGANLGSYGCYGGTPSIAPVAPAAPAMPAPGEKLNPPKTEKTEAFAPATIIVNAPADAKVAVDGQNVGRRTLITPALERGSDYIYSVRAEIVRDGQPLVQTQQITVRAGETSQAQFSFPVQGVASR